MVHRRRCCGWKSKFESRCFCVGWPFERLCCNARRRWRSHHSSVVRLVFSSWRTLPTPLEHTLCSGLAEPALLHSSLPCSTLGNDTREMLFSQSIAVVIADTNSAPPSINLRQASQPRCAPSVVPRGPTCIAVIRSTCCTVVRKNTSIARITQ